MKKYENNSHTTQTVISKTCFCSTIINRAQRAIDGKGNSVSVQILILCPALSFIRIIYAEIGCCSIASHVLSC